MVARSSTPSALWSLALLMAGLTACRSTYAGYRYAPSPLEVVVQPPGEALVARVLLSVQGIRQVMVEDGERIELHVKLRVENESSHELRLMEDEFQLVDAELVAFEPVVIEPDAPEGGLGIGPRATGTFTLRFPFRAGRKPRSGAMSGLLLRWVLAYDGGSAIVSCEFEGLPDPYGYGCWYGMWYDPYGLPHQPPPVLRIGVTHHVYVDD